MPSCATPMAELGPERSVCGSRVWDLGEWARRCCQCCWRGSRPQAVGGGGQREQEADGTPAPEGMSMAWMEGLHVAGAWDACKWG